ncbi:hypothetical protein Acr_03g0014000 [Actinidia rufa]|uniref:Uncharacterized protein n=1 Tax=Actinidia rufa TaxID=165716 RepID=A0A7J0EEM8_9ERIC|nr:hypothetical protein Acr_03g0014000 [Actinidia rufa]
MVLAHDTLLEIPSEEQNLDRYSPIDGEDDGDVGAEVAHDATELRPDGGLEAEVGGEAVAVAPPLTFEEKGGVGGCCSSGRQRLSLSSLQLDELVPNLGEATAPSRLYVAPPLLEKFE